MAGVVILVLLVITVGAVLAYLAQCDVVQQLLVENRDLRRKVAIASNHPSARARRDRAVGEPLFADHLNAIRRHPEPTPTLVLDEVTEEITLGGDS